MPTDRARSTALLADLPVGIDTIRVRGPVARNALARLPRQRIRHDVDAATGEIGETRTSSEGTTASGLPWRVDVWRRDTAEAVFEASIPRLLRGDNSQAASVAEVRSVLEEFHAEVGREVDWLCDADGLSLLRLDLVRTFTGDDHRFGPLLDALERIPPKGLLGTRADRDRSHRGVQSLMRYTDRWCTRLYQRSGYYNNKARGASGASRERLLGLANAERGHLRYEAELKSDALRRNSLHIVDDLHRRSLAEVAERYFEVSRFGFRVGGDGNRMAAAADRALAAGTYSTFSAAVGS